jgi:hypothetical protein
MSGKKFKINFIENYQPKDNDYVWRYINLKKFLSFIIDRKLHLKRLDQYEDKNDGIYAQLLKLQYNKVTKPGEASSSKEDVLFNLQKNLFSSCWFVGNRESIAMWKIYSNPDSVAVRIRFKYLKDIFMKNRFSYNDLKIEQIILGKVNYFNYLEHKKQLAKPKPGHFIAFSKDESFSNEKEYRIVVRLKEDNENHIAGIDLELSDFNQLPFEIVFHPKAEYWGVKNLKDIMLAFEAPFKTFNSELNLRYWIR